jgi:hypothetical protein
VMSEDPSRGVVECAHRHPGISRGSACYPASRRQTPAS